MHYTKKVLKNGLRIITLPMHENPTVTVLVMVEAGSKYETRDINGISHFLEHMCFKGTTKRPTSLDITRELDGLGAHYNAFTSQEYTGYYAKADYKHFDTVLDVVSDMYVNPVFNEQEIEKEKGVIIEEINMYEDLPQQHVQDLFLKLLYGDQPAGWYITGPKEVIRGITRKDFVDYRDKHYVAGATTVVVAGNMKEEQAISAIEKKFEGISSAPKSGKLKVVESQSKPQTIIEFKETDQTHLVIGVRSYDTYHANNAPLRLLGAVLGGGMSSRLFQKLRNEMGVCYYVRAGNDPYTDHGAFQISAGVDNKRVGEVISVILAQLKRFTEELVTPNELKRTKDYLIGNMYLGLEASDDLAEFFGFQEVLKKPIKRPLDIAQEIEKITAEDIKRVAQDIIRNDRLNLAVVGRFKDTSVFDPILKL
jgi:predicted Zn-dependent peptidase